jgi:DNA polymerase-3 subunit gamma/tau
VRFEQGQIEIALTAEAEPSLPQRLGQALKAWTGERWMVAVSKDAVGATAHEMRKKSEASLLEEARADPLVQKVLQRFPGAEIVGVRERQVQTEAGAGPDRLDADATGEAEGED